MFNFIESKGDGRTGRRPLEKMKERAASISSLYPEGADGPASE